jgi:hypothetical protein
MNILMKQALYKVAFLPFGYLIDLWRFRVFDDGRKTILHVYSACFTSVCTRDQT